MIKTGLFFGSFNPIHIGHLIIASYIHQFTDLEEVWIVVSPKNPLKPELELLEEEERLKMAQLAVEHNPSLKVCDIEFYLPKPSYTIDTILRLESDHPGRQFVIIAGTDIFKDLHRWKEWENLISGYQFYIYNRPEYDAGDFANHPSVKIIKAPLLDISSTFIRKALSNGYDIRYMLTEKVWDYIKSKKLYH